MCPEDCHTARVRAGWVQHMRSFPSYWRPTRENQFSLFSYFTCVRHLPRTRVFVVTFTLAVAESASSMTSLILRGRLLTTSNSSAMCQQQPLLSKVRRT